MKLTEIKTKILHYFRDEQGQFQGEWKSWHDNGQQSVICYFRNDMHHGENKRWYPDGSLYLHTLEIDDDEIINFLKNPELYPSTPEEKTMFVLRYGNVPLIRESEDE